MEESPTNVAAWGEQLVSECRDLLGKVLPLTAEEQEFIARLNDRGEIAPELLTSDLTMQATIREHPALCWKTLNVRQYREAQEKA
jgi:hypothetical protein